MPSQAAEKRMERYTLLAGGIEMTIGASMSAFPDVFPWWLSVVALSIAAITVGIGITLVWSDVTKLTAAIGAKPVGLIGPVIAVLGLGLIISLGIWFFVQAPKGFLAGSNALPVLVGVIAIMSFVFMTTGCLPQERGAQEPSKGETPAHMEKAIATLGERIEATAKSIRYETSQIAERVFALKTAHEMRALKRDIDRLILLLDRPIKQPQGKQDWSDWTKRFKKFNRTMAKFESLAAAYFPKEAPNLTFVNPHIYRINEGDFSADRFPDHQTAHDFKTFRQMSMAYDNIGPSMLERIEAKT